MATATATPSPAPAGKATSAASIVSAVITGSMTPDAAKVLLWTMPADSVSTAILQEVGKGKLTLDAAKVLLTPAPVKASSAPFTLKVSEKGAITFRGVPGTHHSFGLTLYAKTVEFLFAHREQIEGFIAANKDKLSWEKAKS